MEQFSSYLRNKSPEPKKSGVKEWLTRSAALAGAVAMAYLGSHHGSNKEIEKDKRPKSLADLSPAKYADMQNRIQSVFISSYWDHISANANPTAQESEARALQIAQLSGVKNVKASNMMVLYEAGIPIEIQINNVPIPINVSLYSEIEISRINHDNLMNREAQ